MLPGVTHHQVYVALDGLEVVYIICIEVQQVVAAQVAPGTALTQAGEVGVLGCLVRARVHIVVARRLGYVVTQVQVEAQVFESVYLIVQLDVAQATLGRSLVVHVQEQGQGVDGRIVVRSVAGDVAIVVVDGIGVAVESVIAVQAFRIVSLGINRFGGVVINGCTHGAGVGETVVVDGTLHVDVHAQVVIEELRAEVDGARVAFVVRGLQRTAFLVVAERYAERQETGLARYGNVLVCAQAGLVDFILPVGRNIGVHVQVVFNGAVHIRAGILAEHGLTELVAIHHVDALVGVFERISAVVRHFDFTLCTFFRSDDDDTV